MALKRTADEYFRSMNSIATRLYEDMEDTKLSYEDLWSTLSEKEQQIIISESIIKPEISIKYTPREDDTKIEYATKLIFDDNCSYRDEHSGPFCFKTQSQRDLSIIQTDPPKCFSETKTKASKLKYRKPPQKILQYQEPVLEKKMESPESDSTNSLPKTGLDFLDNW
ncbi:uncharacterized protein C1orf198 homolog [Leptinotarsa decemlineata]|uniref:uncharacterized protein C1orf198 homolog n=1 Tax=Leptinotarsa decemlineata TaxID=7539 RepID=UPI003D30AB47